MDLWRLTPGGRRGEIWVLPLAREEHVSMEEIRAYLRMVIPAPDEEPQLPFPSTVRDGFNAVNYAGHLTRPASIGDIIYEYGARAPEHQDWEPAARWHAAMRQPFYGLALVEGVEVFFVTDTLHCVTQFVGAPGLWDQVLYYEAPLSTYHSAVIGKQTFADLFAWVGLAALCRRFNEPDPLEFKITERDDIALLVAAGRAIAATWNTDYPYTVRRRAYPSRLMPCGWRLDRGKRCNDVPSLSGAFLCARHTVQFASAPWDFPDTIRSSADVLLMPFRPATALRYPVRALVPILSQKRPKMREVRSVVRKPPIPPAVNAPPQMPRSFPWQLASYILANAPDGAYLFYLGEYIATAGGEAFLPEKAIDRVRSARAQRGNAIPITLVGYAAEGDLFFLVLHKNTVYSSHVLTGIPVRFVSFNEANLPYELLLKEFYGKTDADLAGARVAIEAMGAHAYAKPTARRSLLRAPLWVERAMAPAETAPKRAAPDVEGSASPAKARA